jgi:hypothetical protein
MKILIDQLADMNAEHVRSALELAKEHEIVYWIRIENTVPLDKSLFPGTIFHDYLDAAKNIPPNGIDTSSFEPWGKDEIKKYAAWESELLSMMDKGHSEWPVDKRKDFYCELLRYWGGVVDTLKPDLIVFNAPPHQVFNFVLYAIAKERGIRTINFDVTFRHDRLIASDDYRDGNMTLARAKENGYGSKAVTIDDLPKYLQDHYHKISSEPEPTPAYLTEFKRATVPAKNLWRRIQSLAPLIKDGSIFERGARRLFKSFKPSLKDIYTILQREPDLGQPYVYVPLHYQPECTTSPQGGIYVGQLHLIRTLAAALPHGWQIYVKEHPAQWPSHWGNFTPQRYVGFYEAIAALPNVRIVPITTSTFKLCDRARATATASGTAGWESILRGRPALVFGYPWYMHAPGVFRVGSVADCAAALEKIKNGYGPDAATMLKYLALVDTVIFPGTLSITADSVTDASPDEQSQGMYRAISDALKM